MTSAIDVAEEAARLADLDPRRAIPLAERARKLARSQGDPSAAAIAERAWGHSLVQCGELDAAIRHLRRSITSSQTAGSAALVAQARLKLSYAMIMRGRPRAALHEIDTVLRQTNGTDGATAHAQRGIILREIGRLDEAITEFDRALPALRRADDQLAVAKVLLNRGILRAERFQFAGAVRDLREAGRLNHRLDRGLAVGLIEQNLGYVETLRGDVPAALGYLRQAERTIARHGGQLASVLQDHAELLLSVGLTAEAREVAERAIAASLAEQRKLKLPEQRLLLARMAALEGDWPRSLREAGNAARDFGRQNRAEWACLARLLAWRARIAMGTATAVDRSTVESTVDVLARSGWPGVAVEARLVAATLLGEPAHLARASQARRGGPAVTRARGWYAEALLRLESGNRRGAASAARAGLRILDEHGAALGALDMRVHSARYRGELSELGLRMAIQDGRPASVLAWAERGRASRMLRRQVLPAEDPELAELLAQLRATSLELDRARHAGESTTAPLRRQVALERQIRDHNRLHPAAWHDPGPAPVAAGALGASLGVRAMVEFVQLDGVLHALTVVEGRLRMHLLGPVAGFSELIDRLPFALHRLADRGAGSRSQTAATTLLDHAAAKLDSMVFGGMPELGDRALVLVPTGALHSVPWSVLPSCHGRPVTLSPSASLWHQAAIREPIDSGPVAVAAGPGLACATAEAAAVAEIHGCTPLSGAEATAQNVLAALGVARIAHLATHGNLVVDNPLFSRLGLHDGPLVVYDLERLATVPQTVVLASCDSGRSVVCTGDELLGLSAAFIGRGTTELVASVVPVPDHETAPLMVAMHRRIATGWPAAEALAAAQSEVGREGPAALAVAAGFVCMGAS